MTMCLWACAKVADFVQIPTIQKMGFTKHLTIRPPARRTYTSERRERLLSPGLLYQFFSEVFPERVQINVLYISKVQMDMPFLGSSLGLSSQDPVGGLLAGAFEAGLFNESFSPRRRFISTSRRSLSAKDLAYMLSALTPKRVNRGLNLNNISVGDGPFPDDNGQHTHCITEKAQGRRP